jgi:hypothetical protein
MTKLRAADRHPAKPLFVIGIRHSFVIRASSIVIELATAKEPPWFRFCTE